MKLTRLAEGNISALSAVPHTFSSLVNRCIKSSLDTGGRFAGAPCLRSAGVLCRQCQGQRAQHPLSAGLQTQAWNASWMLTEHWEKHRAALHRAGTAEESAALGISVPGTLRRAVSGQPQSCTTRAGPTTACLCGVGGRMPCVTVGSQLEPHWCCQRQGDPLPLDTR